MSVSTDYLISDLRLQLGDLDETAYRYLDEWLSSALIASVKVLQRWWNFKYLLDDDSLVYRNPNTIFLQPEPPIIETADERVIILMASIIIRGGSLENASWNIVSWRDYEISYSNLEYGRLRDKLLQRDWDELLSLVTPPSKKLAFTKKGSLPGYLGNTYERDTEY